eukprot:scaffold236141_cov70-Attheya_sp.AAC.4
MDLFKVLSLAMANKLALYVAIAVVSGTVGLESNIPDKPVGQWTKTTCMQEPVKKKVSHLIQLPIITLDIENAASSENANHPGSGAAATIHSVMSMTADYG